MTDMTKVEAWPVFRLRSAYLWRNMCREGKPQRVVRNSDGMLLGYYVPASAFDKDAQVFDDVGMEVGAMEYMSTVHRGLVGGQVMSYCILLKTNDGHLGWFFTPEDVKKALPLMLEPA